MQHSSRFDPPPDPAPRLAYRVPIRILVDVDFPVASLDKLEDVTVGDLQEAARTEIIYRLPKAIRDRCVVEAVRLAGSSLGLIDTARLDGGAALIELTVPK